MITIASVLRSICLCLLLNCLLLNWPLYGQVSSRSTLHNAINTAESTQRGMIALFRMRGVTVGSKDFPELRGKDTLHAYIRSAPSEPGMNDNVACLQWHTAIAQTATSSPELEHIPNELQPGKGYTAAEIVGIWQEAPADILSRGEFPKEIAIDLELAPPGDEFSSLLTQLKYKLMRELRFTERP